MRRTARFLAFPALAAVWIFVLIRTAHAGDPLYVSGASYFDPTVKGTPLTWALGSVLYYTDPGDLSPILPHASADALVADAFSRWTNIPTVALTATQGGQLAEDVDGTNVTLGGGVLSLPADIQPGAVATPVGIVYDFDGQVTETLLGIGSSTDCLGNAVYGGLDNFAVTGNFAHALVILNGICAQDPTQLVDFEYRLVRVLGHVIGLGASQANINVWTGSPPPTTADRAGFPVMHAFDPAPCLPITNCLQNADQPKMDDRAALGRLYPNQPLLASTTARIHGIVSFPSGSLPGQGMQGVNVVARWIDPVTLLASRTYVATSVSGCLYRGNAGNPVTGFTDASGQRYDQWGSDDPAVEGFFDLAGLEFPDGSNTTTYEISVEPVDPLFSEAVGSYAPLQVGPSGSSTIMVVTVVRGSDTVQDIVMTGGALAPNDTLDSQDYLNPTAVPPGGEWLSWFNPTGGTNYYWLTAQANRTLSVEVQTVDEQGNATQSKAQPVIGMWSLIDPPGTPPPAATPSPFNTANPGLTRLDAQLLAATDFRIGVTDWRGDGRPDYAHHVRVLYADSISPVRASVAGGDAMIIQGLGFRLGLAAQMGGVAAPVVDFSANQLVMQTPALSDGLQTVVVNDPFTGGFSTMTDAVTMGAGPSDRVLLLPVANPSIPVGGKTPNPLQFLVVATDGTPVTGATVQLSTTNGLTLDTCGGATNCSVLSDGSGRVVAYAGVTAVGVGQVTAQLAPATYPNPSTATTTLNGIASPLDITLFRQLVKVEQGTTIDVPLTARVLDTGTPQTGQRVNFRIAVGHGFLSAPTVVTDTSGNAPNMLHLTRVAADVQVTACVAPNNNPCNAATAGAVPVAELQVEPFDSTQQVVTVGQPVRMVTVRVTDSASPPNPVFGAPVTFLNVLSRSGRDGPPIVVDDVVINPDPELVLLGSATTIVLSDSNGLAQVALWASPIPAGDEVAGFATVDSGAQVGYFLQMLPAITGGGAGGGFIRTQTARNRLPGNAMPGGTGYRSLVSLDSVAGDTAADVDGSPGQGRTAAEKGTSEKVAEPISALEPKETPPKKHLILRVPPENTSPVAMPAPPERREPRSCGRCAGVVCSELPVR